MPDPRSILDKLKRTCTARGYRNPWLGAALELGTVIHRKTVRALRASAGPAGRVPRIGGWLSARIRLAADAMEGRGRRDFTAPVVWSALLHLTVLVLIPLLLGLGSCQRRYGIPEGGAETRVQVQVRQQEKVEERLVFNMNSAISYYVPKLDESDVMEQVDEETRNTYEAGEIGAGPGQGGGYAGGMADAEVRFIRLKYDGGDWDQQMGRGADYNFLVTLNKLTGFRIARGTEAVDFADLKRFPRHGAPPFVYITGSGGIRVSSRDIKVLRWYLLEEGGMLFADNGGGRFNNAFRDLMRQVMPEKSFVDIPNDDVIYREPFRFPNGAPPLWHHSGNRALGIKHEGRWVVFYHQGDINDAWQDGGSGATPALRTQAFQLGVNVVHYAFRQYLARHGR